MENILKNINAVLGVTGCFVCDSDGRLLATTLPEIFDKANLATLGQIITQTVAGLATTRRRKIGDLDLVYGQSRLIAMNLGQGHLCILCVRNINLPLLNLTANMAVKKLIPMVAERRLRSIKDVEVHEEWSARASKLNDDVHTILSAAHKSGVILRATGDAGIRLRCPSASRNTLNLDETVFDLAGLERQSAQINHLLESLGYVPEVGFNILQGAQRLRYIHPQRKLGVEVFLNSLNMYHQLPFADRISLDEYTISLADLLLWKLQYVDPDDVTLGAIYSIITDHEFDGSGGVEKIDSSCILALCTNDWGWYKTVTMNIGKCITWAERNQVDYAPVFLERANHLLKMLKEAPKSVGWQLRARVGESVRWYVVPE